MTMKMILTAVILLNLAACASVEQIDPSAPKVVVEREYSTGSMIPNKKTRSTNDVKSVSSDDFINTPRAIVPTDPLGRK